MCSMPTCCSWFWSAMMVVTLSCTPCRSSWQPRPGNFPLHSRAEIVDVELCDLPRILSGLDVDVPKLHGHARLLPLGICPRRAEAAPAAAAWQHEQRNSTDIVSFTAFSRAEFGIIGAASPRRPTQACHS